MDDSTDLLTEENSETLQALKKVRNREVTAEEVFEADSAPVAEPIEAPAEEAPVPKVKIGEKEFATQEEAFQYAQSLYERGETDKLISDAYRQGIQDAIQRDQFSQNVTQPALGPAAEEDDFDAKFFANPKQFLTDYAAKIQAQAKAEALAEITQKQADENLWSEFFARHPDLDGFREDCSIVLGKEAKEIEIVAKTQGKEKAMDYLARKTRAKFQTYAQRMNPSRELEQGSGRPTPAGGQRVTQGKEEPGPVDLISELSRLKKARNVRY